MVVVVFTACPTPEDPKGTGGDDGGGGEGEQALFTFKNQYVDFHSFYAEIENNTSATLEDAFLVVSTESTPRVKADIHDTAKLIRKFDTDSGADGLKTRNIYIGWTDEFTTAKLATFRNGLKKADGVTPSTR